MDLEIWASNDPDFVKKVEDIVGFYLYPPAPGQRHALKRADDGPGDGRQPHERATEKRLKPLPV